MTPLRSILLLWLIVPWAAKAAAAPFVIRVVDDQTGRGVPLVELRTVHHVSWFTDSAGRAAFDEPGLLGSKVFFHVSSPGYEYPKDGFGHRGVALETRPGGAAEIKIKRLQPAERLYRITGAGIYRDTILAGEKSPLRQPLLNGQVLGQDTVIATPYRGKIYWFWGDTDRPAYPLGNFGSSGATSLPPNQGGLPPETGIDLSYFVGPDGFSRPVCSDKEFGKGLKWIESVFTLPGEDGRERLFARVAAGASLTNSQAWHLAVFDDAREEFLSVVRWPIQDVHDSSHPFRFTEAGVDYLFFYPNYRVRADRKAVADLGQYQSFTCVAGEGKISPGELKFDRDGEGKLLFSWKTGADRLRPGHWQRWIREKKLEPDERWMLLRDAATGARVAADRGSVCWNAFRRRWLLLFSARPGEIWLSEAPSPTGPWSNARRVAEHGRYNFYNPTQHPFFDQEGGRIIYFEGTYTDAFSGAPSKTPRYQYNQILYRLRLDDPRLGVPSVAGGADR